MVCTGCRGDAAGTRTELARAGDRRITMQRGRAKRYCMTLFRGVTVIPVLTIEREADAVPLARALVEGGLPAHRGHAATHRRRRPRSPLSRASCRKSPSAPGPCCAPPMSRSAVQAGARFLVSPGMTPELAATALGGRTAVSAGGRNAVRGHDGARPRHLRDETVSGRGAGRRRAV